jgi:hypothetical protein
MRTCAYYKDRLRHPDVTWCHNMVGDIIEVVGVAPISVGMPD